MKIVLPIVAIIAMSWLPNVISEQQLLVKRDTKTNGKRVARQTSADQMVQNILQWLQGVYTQNSRRVRQGTLREYLPPSNTQKPRPFQPQVTVSPGLPPPIGPPGGNGGSNNNNANNIFQGGYPPAGSITPQPPFPIYTSPGINGGNYPSPQPGTTQPGSVPGFNGYPTSPRPFPAFPGTTGYPSGSTTIYPRPTPGYPAPTTGYPTQRPTTGYPSPGISTGYPTGPTTGYPAPGPSTGYPSVGPTTTYPSPGISTTYPAPGQSTVYPAPGQTTIRPGAGGSTLFPVTGYPTTQRPGYQTTQRPSYQTTQRPGYPTTQRPSYTTQPPLGPSTNYPGTYQPSTPPSVTETFTSPPSTYGPGPAITTIQTPSPEENNVIPSGQPTTGPIDEDLKHPPHIHAIDVQCAKDMMTINIEFNRVFNGVIYSKGFYNTPECRYVSENSGQTKYTFTVSLNSCGTEFINAFDTQGQSYLENILVLQNEPGIQEVWDTIRSVRCLWEGNLNQALSVALSVGMLSQEIVTFSGDTAMAKLDIQLGRGPFAQPANGLVKIGELMTLVVSVSGDPGFDIQVKDCRAKDSTGANEVALTDDNGCVLKPKLFGAFQKTRNTGNTGASIIAYAFFNAFKFPDVMDLMIECNIELCKTDCQMCPDPNQQLEPGRRRKRSANNETIGDAITMGKALKVILPEDISDGKTILNLSQNDGVCMSTHGFVFSSAFLISLLTVSCLFSVYLWLKNQRLNSKQ